MEFNNNTRYGPKPRSQNRGSSERSRRVRIFMQSLCRPCHSWKPLSGQQHEDEDEDEAVEVPCILRLPSLESTDRPNAPSTSPVSPPMRCSYPRGMLLVTEASATAHPHPGGPHGSDRYTCRPLSPIMEEMDSTRVSMLYKHHYSDQLCPATYSQSTPQCNSPNPKGICTTAGPFADSQTLSDLKKRLSMHETSEVDVLVRFF
jgi:hypothetical protein